jgi:prolipoprotein diacylglyceryltransferase
MHAWLFGFLPSYPFMWAIAAALGIAVGIRLAVNAGFPVARSALFLIVSATAILVGSKLFYLVEARFFPYDDHAPSGSAWVDTRLSDFRGILALALVIPALCRILGLPWRRFGDTVIPAAAIALVFIRLGCLLNGCCFNTFEISSADGGDTFTTPAQLNDGGPISPVDFAGTFIGDYIGLDTSTLRSLPGWIRGEGSKTFTLRPCRDASIGC